MSQTTDEMKGQGHDEHDGDLIQLVTFRIGEEEFGVDILAVQEIIPPSLKGSSTCAAR